MKTIRFLVLPLVLGAAAYAGAGENSACCKIEQKTKTECAQSADASKCPYVAEKKADAEKSACCAKGDAKSAEKTETKATDEKKS